MNNGIGDHEYFRKHYLGRTPERYHFLLSQIIQYSKPWKILDVGSGLGLFLKACENWNWDAVGI